MFSEGDLKTANWKLHEWAEGNYTLLPDEGIAVEGPYEDWLEIARSIRRGAESHIEGRRCAFRRRGNTFAFYSPRNSMGNRDHILMSNDEAQELADAIFNQFGDGAGI